MKPNMPKASLVVLVVLAGLLTTLSLSGAANDRGLAVPRQDLPDDLQAYDVKDFFIPLQAETVGYIQAITGSVVVVHEKTGQAYFAAQGDALYQQDSFITLKNGRCRIKFTTQDVVTMGTDTRMTVKELVDDRKTKKKKSLLSMLRGKAMFYVVRLFKYKRTEASVTTPTAVCGVRGTQFGVEVQNAGSSRAEGLPIYLADASGQNPPLLALANTGDRTVVYFYDGQGELCNADGGNCFPVKKGDSGLVDQDGNVYVSMGDPAAFEKFRRATRVGSAAGEEDQIDMRREQHDWAGTPDDKKGPLSEGEHTKDAIDDATHGRSGFIYEPGSTFP